MPTTTEDRPTAPRYTRPLTFSDLYDVAHALGQGITRLTDEMMSASDGANDAELWSELRNVSEALAAITDHVCNDARYWDDDDGPATETGAPETATQA